MKKPILCAAALSLLSAAAPPPDFDIVIRGGRVLDGTGNPWVRADVAIKGGRIAQVGAVAGRGRREIDAADRYVSPGFIDMMDQSGGALAKSGAAENKLLDGVTTVIAGEGGAPVPAAELGAYFRQLERQGIAVNFGTYYAPVQARTKVVGDGDGRPSPAQLDAMGREVDTAMRAGAFGISAALIYPPDGFQTTADLVAMAKVASRCGGALYSSHMRDESAKLLPAIDEAIAIGEQGGVKVEIYHLKAAYQPGWGTLMPQALAKITAARARGVDVAADMYVYDAAGTGLDVTVPGWIWKDGEAKGFDQLADPAVRARLKTELAKPGQASLLAAAGGWDHIVLANSYSETYRRFHGQSIAAIGTALKRDPADVAWDIMLAARPQRALALYFVIGEQDIEAALRQPWVSIGSDAGAALKLGEVDAIGLPHPRAYGNFARVLSEYVKRRHILTLEEAVRKMTGWPAARMGLEDRGLVREGMRADLLLFDLDRVRDRATYREPLLTSQGFDTVIVNGQVAVEAGRPTGQRSGMILRHACNAGQPSPAFGG